MLGFIILGVAGIQLWEYSNSVAFCSNVCHDVHPEETEAFQDSLHARVKCTECHMGRTGTLRGILLKATHFRHLPAVLFENYDRPLRSETMRPANESCELCHWPASFHYDSVLQVKRFQPNELNTESRIYLVLKTGSGDRVQGLAAGIHWHIQNRVEYVARDEEKQKIIWVRATGADGELVEYIDVTAGFSADELHTDEIRVLDRNLPYIKREMLALLIELPDAVSSPADAGRALEERYESAKGSGNRPTFARTVTRRRRCPTSGMTAPPVTLLRALARPSCRLSSSIRWRWRGRMRGWNAWTATRPASA